MLRGVSFFMALPSAWRVVLGAGQVVERVARGVAHALVVGPEVAEAVEQPAAGRRAEQQHHHDADHDQFRQSQAEHALSFVCRYFHPVMDGVGWQGVEVIAKGNNLLT